MAVLTTDVTTEYGAYYANSGQNKKRLFQKLRFLSETDMVGTVMLTDETVFQASEALIGELLQPWQKTFTPKGDLTFKAAPIYMKKMKVDIDLYPDDIEGTWLQFLASDELKDRSKWPLIRYMLEAHVVPKMAEDWEAFAVYKGVFVAPTTGTPGAASTSINGIKKVINTWITAGRITPIATGAPSANASNWVGQVEAFVDAIQDQYFGAKMQLNMSPLLYKRFITGMRALYANNTDFSMNLDSITVKDRPNITVKYLNSMIGSDKIWMTPKDNLRIMQKRTMDISNIQVETQKRVVNIMMDLWKGVGFLIPEIVFTNDRDLV